MGSDCYQVDVLHYLNPHLIWVEVIDKKRDEEFVFEQIGVYGVLPFETTIDSSGTTLKPQKCPEWVSASTIVMKGCLADAAEVWFRPTHIDRRTSIFDDNIHKYGELLIKTSCNQIIELSTALTESGFALYNVCLFHQELCLGNLKTKLSNSKILEVIKHLEKGNKVSSKKQREQSVKKQTTVFNAAHTFENSLTTQNLERHNKKLKHIDIDKMVEKKTKDFDRCKDIDDVSVGRASHVKHTESNVKTVPLLIRKKLDLIKSQKCKPNDDKKHLNSPLEVLMATKRFLEENAKFKSDDYNITEKDLNQVESGSHEKKISKYDYILNKNKETNMQEYPLKKEICNSSNSDDIQIREINKISEVPEEQVAMMERVKSVVTKKENVRSPANKVKKYKKSINVPEYDIITEARVAYGPPGLDKKYLNLKVIPKSKEDDEILVAKDNRIEVHESRETYADVDSHVDIQITNRDIIKEMYNKINNDPRIDHGQVKEVSEDLNSSNTTDESISESKNKFSRFAMLQKKLKIYKETVCKKPESIVTSSSDTTNKDSSSGIEEIKPKKEKKKTEYLDSDDDEISVIIEKVNQEYNVPVLKRDVEPKKVDIAAEFNNNVNVNPFKNIDASMSVFVDKLVSPVLMVHSKMNKRIEPNSNIRDVNFNNHIHEVLKNMSIERPMMLQMVSWPVILRGYSLFMVSPLGSGKTLGYLPALCRLITDFKTEMVGSVGPTSIIVCATAQSVTDVERLARMFLGLEEKVLSCYAGMDELHITTSLLNGCDLFICTPSVLVRLLRLTDFGVDLRRLTSFVLEDCERLTEVYANEVKYFLLKIKEMLKTRANKELKVQYIVASRVWCDFLEPIVKKAPNSVVCIGAFQECVLYSKANTAVNFVRKEKKINLVLDFLNDIDNTKKTVIVCRSNDEVEDLEKILTKHKYVVFACNNTMTVEDLYNLSKAWVEYEEPLLGPVLICCDGNLTHLNVTDAHYLIHYSLPQLFSMFCKRFSVVNDNYPSIFNEQNDGVKIKVFLEDTNVEQLPKILNFIKRCTNSVPEFLDKICDKILHEKDTIKGKNLVPVCDSLLTLGECQDFWNCQERHAIFPEYDKPKDWVPTSGIVKFKILYYHTAIRYSARLLSNSVQNDTKKYPQTYSTLSLKMGMYFSKEANRKLLGTPKVGDICAVSVKQNFCARCQVLKILNSYNNGTPNWVLIRLIDEEKLERARDIYLYYLPDELKKIETHVVQIRLANIRPKDKDVSFSDLAKDQLKKITDEDEDLYMRGQVVLTVGNCVFVDTLDVCQELTSLNETVVRYNFKKEMLDTHAIANVNHIPKLQSLCKDCGFNKKEEQIIEVVKQKKMQPKPQWAHLESSDLSSVFFASAESPATFFVRLTKFESCMKQLLKDVDKYIEQGLDPVTQVQKGDILLAKFPDDGTYERARIDEVLDDCRVKCFFVDQGDWREVLIKDLVEIPDKFITQMPFQAIECRLIGAKPAGDNWTEFGTNWFYDSCFELDSGELKQLYVKYFTKDKSSHTGGSKYGVALIDTNSDQDVVINQLMIDLNLAQEKEEEIHFLNNLKFNKTESSASDISSVIEDIAKPTSLVPITSEDAPKVSLDNVFLKKPIRSVPLIDSDNESDASDKWDIGNPADFASGLKSLIPGAVNQETKPSKVVDDSKEKVSVVKNTLPAIKNSPDAIPSQNSTLDSDDLSSTQSSQLSEKVTTLDAKPQDATYEKTRRTSYLNIPVVTSDIDELRKPKLLWRQNKSSVMVKILLIGVENYDIKIKERSIKFFSITNDTKYGFEFDLYGVIDHESAVHSNKGQYILVKFNKLMKRNWLTLTKDGSIRKWIVYDVDSIDTSSDEEDEAVNPLAEMVKNTQNRDRDSDSDDDEFLDDVNYEYKRDFD